MLDSHWPCAMPMLPILGATLPEEPPNDRCHAGRSEYRAYKCQLLLCMPGDMAVWKASGTIYNQRRGQDSQRKEFGSVVGAASQLRQLGITMITMIPLAAAPSSCASKLAAAYLSVLAAC